MYRRTYSLLVTMGFLVIGCQDSNIALTKSSSNWRAFQSLLSKETASIIVKARASFDGLHPPEKWCHYIPLRSEESQLEFERLVREMVKSHVENQKRSSLKPYMTAKDAEKKVKEYRANNDRMRIAMQECLAVMDTLGNNIDEERRALNL